MQDTAEQRQELRSLMRKKLRKSLLKGDTWYLLDVNWFKQLKKYLKYDDMDSGGGGSGGGAANEPAEDEIELSDHPGPIDNTPLFNKDNGEDLKEQLIDDLDYMLIPDEVWKNLVDTFGMTEGQSPIARKVVEHGMFVKHCKVEVYLMDLNLAEYSKPTEVKKCRFSKCDTLETIEKEMRSLFSIDDGTPVRIWSHINADTYELITNMENTVTGAGLFQGSNLVIEQKNKDGTWPRPAESSGNKTYDNNGAIEKKAQVSEWLGSSNNATRETTPTPSSSSSSSAITTTTAAAAAPISTRYNYGSYGDGGTSDKAQPGLCGLSNLGNTCFMNSIIQGLSNCPPITEYFANDNYVEDINDENPLGMKGEIARSFGELIKSMWSGKYSFVMPRNFKMAVGTFAPQFSGYQQQDSQELLTFLLDGLHEDLNRVKKKPYIELKDSDNRPDEEVAGEAWKIYKIRNDSVILDLFHGLLKSTVVCPECPKVSVTFDPFCHLSLPLPVKKERKIEVFLVYRDPTKCPKQYKVTCPKNGSMDDLCKALSSLSDVPAANMVVTDVYNHRFHKIYNPEDGLSHILERDDIFVYEVPTSSHEDPATALVAVYLREKKSSLTYSPSNLFGQPLLIGVPREGTNYEKLYDVVLSSLSRYVTPPPPLVEGETPMPEQEWWKPAPAATPQVNGDSADGAVNSSPQQQQPSSSTADQANAASGGETSAEDTTPSSEGIPPSPLSEVAADDTEVQMEDEEDDKKGPPKLFSMNFVNSYGNAQLEQLNNDDKPIRITSKAYLSLDWHSKAKELFYSEKAADDFAQDNSFDAKPTQKKQVRLEECLELYTSKEKLGENDAWYCPNCKKHQQATKKFDLWSLPSLLVISLKRFSYNRYWRDKLDTMVEFPTRGLDMAEYVINPNHGKAIYDLVAVSNHYGGMGGGHYTAYAKNKDDGKWYYFDDSSVTISSEDAAVTKAAYVLFYQRRDLSEQNNREPRPPAAAATAHNNAASSSTNNSMSKMNVVSNMCNGDGPKTNGDASSEEEMDVN